jgi:hypothetical protein
MKKYTTILCATVLFSCHNADNITGKFIVNGQIKNAPDQKIYGRIIFSEKES